jgi:hypothetical protein
VGLLLMWRFYLLAVVQSLWLDLSHSSSTSRLPPSSSLISDAGLETLLRDRDYGINSNPQTSSGDLIVSELANEFWEDISTRTNSFKTSVEIALTAVLTEIQSKDYSSVSPVSLSHVRDSSREKPIDHDYDFEHSFSSDLRTLSFNTAENSKCVELQAEESSLELCFSTPSCTDFSLADFLSKYKSPTSLFMAIRDLSVSCSTDWSLTYTTHIKDKTRPHTFEYEGTFGFDMSNFKSSVILNLIPGASSVLKDIQIPTALKLENCQVDETTLEFDVFFSGGAIGRVLDRVVSPVLSEAVLNSADWLLCDVLGPLLGRVATRVLATAVDPRVDSLMALGVPPPPVLETGYHSWSTSVLQSVHQMVDLLRVNEASLLKCVVRESSGGGPGGEREEGVTGSDAVNDSSTPPHPPSSSSSTPAETHSPLMHLLQSLQELLEASIKDSGSLTLDLRDLGIEVATPMLAGMSLDIIAVSIDGFKTLSDMQLLYPSAESNVTLNSSLSFAALALQLEIRVTQPASSAGGGQRQSRDIRIAVQLRDLVIDLGVVVGLRSSVLEQLSLQQVVQLPCLLSSLEQLFVASLLLRVNVTDLTMQMINSTASGDAGEDLNELVNSAFELLLEGYPAMTSQLITGLFQGPIRESMNKKISVKLEEQHSYFQCETPSTNSSISFPNWIEWSNSTLVQALNKVVNDLVGTSGVNSILSCLTEDSNAVLINVPLTFPVFAGWNITISGLNSFYEFYVLSSDADTPYDLLTDLALGGECATTTTTTSFDGTRDLGTSGCVPLNVTIQGYEHNLNYVDVKLSVKNMQFLIDLLLEVDRTTLGNMQVSEFQTKGCFANAIDLFQIASWSLHASNVEFFFVGQTEEMSLTKLANGVFDVLISPANQESFNEYLSYQLASARELCEAGGVSPSSDSSDSLDQKSNQMDSMMHFFRHTWKWKVVVLILGTLVSFSLLLRMYYRTGVQLDKSVGDYHLKRSKRSSKNSSLVRCDRAPTPEDTNLESDEIVPHPSSTSEEVSPESGNFLSNQWIQYYIAKVRASCSSKGSDVGGGDSTTAAPYDSLIGNETLSLFTRLSVVAFILLIVYIFVISTIPSSPAALVILEIDMGNQVSPAITVFEFGLAETIREMWRAEVYYLAILIAFFTGGWPYIKMVAMLLAWILPSSVLSVAWRNTLLTWLDLLGKWSLVDSFVMMVMMVGFNFSFDIVPGVDIRVTVNPLWGFYAFLLATAASLAIGHYVLACHRLCRAVAVKELEERTLANNIQANVYVEGNANLSESEGCFLESAESADTDCHVKESVQGDTLHLHSQWGDKEIVPSVVHVESEALMNHVFTVHVTNTDALGDTLHHHAGDVDVNDLTTPLVRADNVDKHRADSTAPVVHLADLAEWTFQPGSEPSYTLRISFTQTGKLCVLSLFGLSTLVVLGGTFVPVIEFDFIGLTGYLMDDPVTSYSLVDIGLKIPVASGDPHTFGVLFIQMIYFIFGIGMPLVLFAMLGALFVLPFALPTFRGVVVLTEVLNAWTALDVLVVSAVASVLEIRRFAEFMLGASCSEMNIILEATMDETLEGNDSCFDVIAAMKDVSERNNIIH